MHQNSGWENYIYVPAFMAASHLNPFVLISSQSSYFKKKLKWERSIRESHKRTIFRKMLASVGGSINWYKNSMIENLAVAFKILSTFIL